ncbi:MAG: hypothetical protein WAV28_04370 [Sedimentisphaerales bacterium]|jgi:uncharacterized protein YwgA
MDKIYRMDEWKRRTILLSLIEKLVGNNSWCGETHIQKSSYFLQELSGVPLGYDFILYKYGPYSFELSDDITAMRANKIVELEPMPAPYGPTIVASERSKLLKKLYPKTMKRYKENVTFIADQLAKYNVAELERIATAFYVSRQQRSSNNRKVIAQITRIKPHISVEQARKAFDITTNISKLAKSQ